VQEAGVACSLDSTRLTGGRLPGVTGCGYASPAVSIQADKSVSTLLLSWQFSDDGCVLVSISCQWGVQVLETRHDQNKGRSAPCQDWRHAASRHGALVFSSSRILVCSSARLLVPSTSSLAFKGPSRHQSSRIADTAVSVGSERSPWERRSGGGVE
jgi:hypothetical protein